MPRHLRLAWMAVILALAFIIRIQPLSRGLGQDELFTAVNFVQAGSMWTTMSSNSAFNNHIGYSVMARVSGRLFGGSEWSLRLPALLLGLISLYLFWIFSEPILTSFGALVGVLLLALSPPHVVWSVEARGYSAMISFAILSSFFYLRLLRRPVRRDALCYVFVSVAGIYTHLYSIFVVAIQFLIFAQLVISRSFAERTGVNMRPPLRRLVLLSILAIGILSLLAYAPAASAMVNDLIGRGHGRFDPALPWAIIQRLSGSEQFSITGITVLITVFGAYSLWKSHPLEARYFVELFVVPVLLTWAATQPFDLYPRFFAYWLPFYIVLLVAGLTALWNLAGLDRHFITRLLARAALAIVSLMVLYDWNANRSGYIPDEGYREASTAAMFDAHNGVRYCAIGGARSVWRYYIHQPIATPASVNELQKLGKIAEVRCLYYDASWQSDEQRKIAEFLRQHADWQKIRQLTVFRYAANQTTGPIGSHHDKSVGG